MLSLLFPVLIFIFVSGRSIIFRAVLLPSTSCYSLRPACRDPPLLLNFNMFGTFLPFDDIRHFGLAHTDHGLCRPSPYVEIRAVELAADGPDKLIHSICWSGLSHVELTAAVVDAWSLPSCFHASSLRLIACWYSYVRFLAFSPDTGTGGTLHDWWRGSNLNTCFSHDNVTALVLTCCLALDNAVAVLSRWWS